MAHRIKDAGHIARMYGRHDFMTADGRIGDLKFRDSLRYITFEHEGYDPRNHHGRHMHPQSLFNFRQTELRVTAHSIYLELFKRYCAKLYGHDPYNYHGARL